MKKSLLLILAVFSFTFANAQGFKIGIKGGGNYSSLGGSDKDKVGVYIKGDQYTGDAKYKYGYHMGLTSLYEIDDFWGIKIDALYTTKGFQVQQTTAVGVNTLKTEVKRSLNYLSLPVLLNINAGGLYFEVGPEVAYMTNTTSEIRRTLKDPQGDQVGNTDKDETSTSKEDLSSVDFGYVAGLGYMSDMGLGLGLRYNGGLGSIYDTKNVDHTDEVNAKNSNFTVSLFYMFGGN
jgi:hypothetical protein